METSPLHQLQPREGRAGQGHAPVRIGFNLAKQRRTGLSVPEHEELVTCGFLSLREPVRDSQAKRLSLETLQSARPPAF